MSRYDKSYRNAEIAQMIAALRKQALILYERLSMLEVRTAILAPDEVFHDADTRDAVTDVSMGAKNIDVETTVLWKRTR